MDSLEELMHEIAIKDKDTNYTVGIPRINLSRKNKINNLRSKIAKLNHTKEILKLYLRLDLPPSFISHNINHPISSVTKLLSNTLSQINTLYINFLTATAEEATKQLKNICPINWSPTETSTLKPKQGHSQEQVYLDNYHKRLNKPPILTKETTDYSRFQLSLKGLPQFHDPALIQQINRTISSFFIKLKTPTSDPLVTDKPSHKDFTLRQLHNCVYSIDSTTTPTIFDKEILASLALGLKFVPVSHPYPLATLTKSFEDFKHKLSWKLFWSLKKPNNPVNNNPLDIPPLKLRQKLKKTTPPHYKKLNTFINNSYKSLSNELSLLNKAPPIVTQQEINIKRMLNFFKKQKNNFIIKPADKGGAIVIINTAFYKQSIEATITKSGPFYIQIPADPTPDLCVRVTRRVTNLYKQGKIDKRTLDMILPDAESRCPALYGLPKIHNPTSLPFRPILSGNGNPTENASILIDFVLQPISTSHPLYLKDTTNLLNLLSPLTFPVETIPFTLDVIGMYPNIPIPEAIQATKEALKLNQHLLKHNNTTYNPNAVLELLDIVLNENFFQFNQKFYHQKHGIAMGTPCACTVADTFICAFMENALKLTKLKPFFYKQYRDDGIGFWHHGLTELNNFVQHLNTLHPTIKFTMTTGHSVNYLDTTLSIDNDQKINSQTYYKATATFDYLHPQSNHPKHCKENIAISQNIRHIRNCTKYSTYNHHVQLLKTKLIQRGYSLKLLKKKLLVHSYKERVQLLKYKQRASLDRVPLVVLYDSKLPDINKILDKELKNANIDDTELTSMGGRPIIGYQIHNTIGKKLIQAKFKLLPKSL